MTISYYNGVLDRVGVRANISTILKRIELGHYIREIESVRANPADAELKKALPAACFSGVFTERKDSALVKYSGIVTLDIDEKDYQKVIIAKALMLEDPYIYCIFESPNRGLKILFKVKQGADMHRDVSFPQIKDYVEDNYGLDVDPSGKNISRLCFISYDPDMYLNEDCMYFDVDESYRPAEFYRTTEQVEFQGYEASESLAFIFDKACEWTNRNCSFVKGNRNNYIFQLSCLLNKAGMNQGDAKAMIMSRLNPNMPVSELNATITGVYSRNRSEHGSRPIFQKKSNNSTLF
jgi:hypothetical protein